jgi:hypothetical protein
LKTRNIVEKFIYFKEREIVRRVSPVKKTSKNNSFYINEQFPSFVADRSKLLLKK